MSPVPIFGSFGQLKDRIYGLTPCIFIEVIITSYLNTPVYSEKQTIKGEFCFQIDFSCSRRE